METHAKSKRNIIKNLIVLCLGFLFLFSSYMALANLQSTLNMASDLGVISQSIIYVALIISALLLPKLVIRRFGCKLTLVVSMLTYAPYVAANFYPAMSTLLPTAILIGLGAAPLWAAKCTYLNELSELYATQTSDSVDVVTSRFFGVFFMVFQNTQIWGNLASFFVLMPSSIDEDIKADSSAMSHVSNSSLYNVTCGVEFCSGVNENLLPPSDDKRYMLIGIYLALTVLAAGTVAIFLDPLPVKEETVRTSTLSRVVATLTHMKKKEQLLLIPLTVYSGIQQAFLWSDFSQAYVACTWGIYHVGLVLICFGVADAVMSFVSGRLVRYVPRISLMVAAAVGNVALCAALILWKPTSEEFYVFFLISGFWGLCDGIWQTQVNALYGILFRTNEEAGFANYRLWESVGLCMAFGYNGLLCVPAKLTILLAFLLIGMACYVTLEVRKDRQKEYVVNVT